jgi:predicted glutamine amidotransferase
MCTIITYKTLHPEIIKQIKDDIAFNADGLTLIQDNISINIMEWNDNLLTILDKNKRIFIHTRMATTTSVGVQHTHGFRNALGHYVLHNGWLTTPNAKAFAVDSASLATFQSAYEAYLFSFYKAAKANVIWIDFDSNEYTVFRTGSYNTLYTDGKGNYSTNKIAMLGITKSVKADYCEDHKVPVTKKVKYANYAGYYNKATYNKYKDTTTYKETWPKSVNDGYTYGNHMSNKEIEEYYSSDRKIVERALKDE